MKISIIMVYSSALGHNFAGKWFQTSSIKIHCVQCPQTWSMEPWLPLCPMSADSIHGAWTHGYQCVPCQPTVFMEQGAMATNVSHVSRQYSWSRGPWLPLCPMSADSIHGAGRYGYQCVPCQQTVFMKHGAKATTVSHVTGFEIKGSEGAKCSQIEPKYS